MPIAPAAGIHIAAVLGDLVFLDAGRDEYLCLGGDAASTLLARLTTCHAPAGDIEVLLEAQGLIVSVRQPCWSSAASTARFDLGNADHVRTTLLDLVVLVAACAPTLLSLWRDKPSCWFRSGFSRRPQSAVQHARALNAARRFDRLRPLIPRSGRCLVRSLLLLHFLRLHGVTPKWVFGVRTHPFEAHCWLEHDGVVLDDTLDHVTWFTPIAVA